METPGRLEGGAERAELERMRRELEGMIADVDDKLRAIERVAGREDSGRRRDSGRPLRDLVLDGLEDLGTLAYSRELGNYITSRHGRGVPPTRFGTLGSDEMRAYLRGSTRPVWICFGLTHHRGEPIRRLLARSDWELWQRVVAPTTGRIQHLKITERLANLALEAAESAADPLMLKIIVADHARDLPGVEVKRGEFELERWRDVAREQLVELEPRDEELRRKAAQRIARLDPYHQLFGVPDVVESNRVRRRTGGRP